MHFFSMGKSTIDGMNSIQIKGWMAMIPAINEQFGNAGPDANASPTDDNVFRPM